MSIDVRDAILNRFDSALTDVGLVGDILNEALVEATEVVGGKQRGNPELIERYAIAIKCYSDISRAYLMQEAEKALIESVPNVKLDMDTITE